jgi:hypothetical protein
LHHVGNLPVDCKGSLPMANTLAHHAQAALRFLRQVMEAPFSIYESGTSKPTLVPFIGDRISQRRKWQKPRDKQEPYTFAMLHTFFKQVSQSEKDDSCSFLGKDSLIFNSQCLGIFTGSRVSKYAQSKGKVTDVSRVPTNPSNPSALPLPLAFVASNFLFLSASGIVVPHHDIYTQILLWPPNCRSLSGMTRVDKTIPSESLVQDDNGYAQSKPPLASCIAPTSLPPTQLNPSASIAPVAHKVSPTFGILMSPKK